MIETNNYAIDNRAVAGRKTKHRRMWSVLGVSLIAVILAVGSMIIVSHQLALSHCQESLVIYQQQADQLVETLASYQESLSITTDDVLETDKDKVNNFQTLYKQAEEELTKDVGGGQCVGSQAGSELKRSADDLITAAGQLAVFNQRVEQANDEVAIANQVKLLADAKSALDSTTLSARSLSQNYSLSASIRTQLNRAVSMAESIQQSNDLEDILSAREQLDDIIQEVSESLRLANAELLDIEEQVRAIETQADSNGSYEKSATQVLDAAGLQAVWGLEKMRGACSLTDEEAASWLAAFCTATPSYVYISTTAGPMSIDDAYFTDAMRHEVAHYLIYRRCGTADPASIGDRANAESTASSYAVLYLGANANSLNRAADPRYHMDQASDEAAARIHAGQCY